MLGFAVTQPPPIIATFFLLMAAGMSLPYFLLTWHPEWMRFLPKPGAWMERFKVAMGFPMLATALWLASLVSDQYGERAWWLGIFLVFVGIAAWVFAAYLHPTEWDPSWSFPTRPPGRGAPVS